MLANRFRSIRQPLAAKYLGLLIGLLDKLSARCARSVASALRCRAARNDTYNRPVGQRGSSADAAVCLQTVDSAGASVVKISNPIPWRQVMAADRQETRPL